MLYMKMVPFLCVLWCFFKHQLCLNVFSHVMHAKGFSPVWVLSCFLKPHLCLNVFSTFSACQGLLSCVSHFMLLQTSAVFKSLPHILHGNGSSPVSAFMLLQTSAVLKCILTCDGCKGLFTCVGTFVCLETKALFKCLSTYSECRWIFSCVGHFNLHQIQDFLMYSHNR